MTRFSAIAFGFFWVAAIKLWFTDGPKIPVISIVLWFVFLLSVPFFHLPGIVFIIAQTVLGLALLLIDRYKSALQ